MGAIGGFLGLNGGASGSGFAAPSAAPNLQAGFQQGNINNANQNLQAANQDVLSANGGVQNTLGSQNALLAALQSQGGIGNQSQVYNQMQGTAQQYQNIANGQGPNPAQAALNQSTGQNVANTGALLAGQRGAGANAGLIARQAAQQGAATQQQAVGQAATLQAQQQLAGLSGLQTQQANLGSLANTQAGNQIGQTNANTQAQLANQEALMGQQQNAMGQYQNLLGAQANYNNANVGMQSNLNSANAGLANTTMQNQQKGLAGGMQALGAAAGLANGGQVKNYDSGGLVNPGSAFGPQSEFGQFMINRTKSAQAAPSVGSPNISSPSFGTAASADPRGTPKEKGPITAGSDPYEAGATDLIPDAAGASGAADAGALDAAAAGATMVGAKGGTVPALVSPGEKYLSPRDVRMVARGANPMKVGETIPGKPKVSGAKNSYANDIVPKKLEVGGVVVPRSETKSKNPEHNSKAFVDAILAKRRAKK